MLNELEKHIIQKSEEYSIQLMRHIHSSHGWDHVQRVMKNAEHISAAEKGADHFIVRASAVLHDIARAEQDRASGTICHAEKGSRMAYDFLIEEGLDTARAGHIADCILTHRYRNKHVPETIEAKILYDADKLDSIGAVGIGRAFLFSGEVGAKLHNPGIDISTTTAYSDEDTAYREFIFKLRFIKDRMLTTEGRRVAEERHLFMEVYFERLKNEVAGER